MEFNRQDVIYRNGVLAEQERERVSDVPLRYKHSWTVYRVIELTEAEVDQHPQHCVRADDAGVKVMYARTEELGGWAE